MRDALTYANNKTKVVVFIPPPVDPGEAPIYINNKDIKREASFVCEISIVLKPAVRKFTEANKERSICLYQGKFTKVLFFSKIKNPSVPTKISNNDTRIAISV